MNLVLQARNLKRVYTTLAGDSIALEDISLEVRRGEFIAIMGPSGSGKSTLMNIIGLLDKATSGSYILNGIDVSQLNEVEQAQIRAQQIGFVFQSFNLLPRTSVMKNVVLPLEYTRYPRADRLKRAKEALAQVDLDERFFSHKSNEISGGQMQRIAIARALVNNPAIILADEPTGNLDSKTGDMVLATFERLRDEGKTIILITHESDIAARADRAVHIKDGLLYTGAYREEVAS